MGLDFDGTLAPITDDPDAASITRPGRAAVARLVRTPGVTVAVVSGRAVADLRTRVDLPGVVYLGNHGLEMHAEGTTRRHAAAASARPALRRVLAGIRERAGDVPGLQVEDKTLTGTVHYRQVPPSLVPTVETAVTRSLEEQVGPGPSPGGDPGGSTCLQASRGKQIVELRPAVDWDKGTALDHLAGTLELDARSVYVGDDTTDEDAFAALSGADVGVLVGGRRDSLADYRLVDQTAVAPFLEWLATTIRSCGDRPTSGRGSRAQAIGPRATPFH